MQALYEGVYLLQKESRTEYIPSERYRLILPAVEKMDTDFNSCDLTVEVLAELCNMSTTYFRKIFFHSFGISPKEYIIRKRMEYAKQLLALDELEISSIASLCGYSEPCHFSREFKKRFASSPKNYK